MRLCRWLRGSHDRTQARWRFRLCSNGSGSDPARVRDLHANRIIYVVDARQSDHLDLVFAVARKAGFLPDDVITEHVAFGTVLGTDGKPFKTREGTAVNLNTLLDAAEEQAAPPVALAAIKYADLSNGLNKDYVFDVIGWCKPQATPGRICSTRTPE